MTVIAIDGPAGAGKSTIARRLAEDLGWAYLDTGAMYRAVTWRALEKDIDLDDAQALVALARDLPLRLTPDGVVHLGAQAVTASALRTPRIDRAVSQVASVADVRAVMVRHQRAFAEQNGRIVAEGRDIGTVVFPDADLKLYLDADPSERARRRGAERGEAEVAQIQAEIERRDHLDTTRPVAPLEQAADAHRIDTTHLTLAQVFDAVRLAVQSAVRT